MELLLTRIAFLVSIGFQLVILLILIRRRLHQRFPWFVAYIVYSLIEAGLRLSAAGNRLYFYIYWFTAIGEVILSVLAVRESFLNVFWIYTRFRWFTRVVWGCVGLALLYSVFRAWAFPPVHAKPTTATIIALESAVYYSLTAVGLLYFLLVRFQKIREHQWESAIISGFTTIATLSVLAELTRSVFGLKHQLFSQWAEPVAYILAEIEWALVLSLPEREAPAWIREREITVDDLTRLDEYMRVLERLLGKK